MRPARPNPTFSTPLDADQRLDRVWEATRPADPSPATIDAFWAHASAELDRIEAARGGGTRDVLPIDSRWSRRRRIGAGILLAQAAALLVGLGLAWLPRQGEPVGPIAVVPLALHPDKPIVDVGAEQTLFVRIDQAGPRYDYLDQPAMLPTMADNTSHDFFNAMEDAANQ